MAASFPDTVAAVLEAENTDPKLLTPEVTESVFVRDSRRALIVLNDLKDLEVMIALDDFGTGYSSLSDLTRSPSTSSRSKSSSPPSCISPTPAHERYRRRHRTHRPTTP